MLLTHVNELFFSHGAN